MSDPKTWNPDSHWDNHPIHLHEDWALEVINNETRQSYVAWVNSRLEEEEDNL